MQENRARNVPKMKMSDFQTKNKKKKKLYKPDEATENPEMIKKIEERQSKQDTECKLDERSCCVGKERNRNIILAKKTGRKTGLEKKEE